MSSRTQSRNSASQWLESREARLNPPMDDDEAIFDPFAELPDGGDAQLLARLRLMFDWTPPREQLH